MRLPGEIAKALSDVVASHLTPAIGSELFLFGSRADAGKKGGDIDLLLVADVETKNRYKSRALNIRSALREAANDQKVDLSVISAEEKAADPFFSSLVHLISLQRW